MELFLQLGFYYLAKFIVPIVTIGKVKSKSLLGNKSFCLYDRPHFEKKDDIIFLGPNVSILVGALIFTMLTVAILILFVN